MPWSRSWDLLRLESENCLPKSTVTSLLLDSPHKTSKMLTTPEWQSKHINETDRTNSTEDVSKPLSSRLPSHWASRFRIPADRPATGDRSLLQQVSLCETYRTLNLNYRTIWRLSIKVNIFLTKSNLQKYSWQDTPMQSHERGVLSLANYFTSGIWFIRWYDNVVPKRYKFSVVCVLLQSDLK